MSVLLKEKIKEAILTVRWRQSGDGPNPNYFESMTSGSFRLSAAAASFLAEFITNHINHNTYFDQNEPDTYTDQNDLEDNDLESHSLEVIASYLEGKGYTVSLPD